jgi:hypothetical protein
MPKLASNLFAIDHDAIRAVLADANRRLIERKNELCSALLRVPETLSAPDHIARAQVFTKQLQAALRESRSSRLSDGRPFRDATATVTSFFAQIDGPLQAAAATMRERLTEAALRVESNRSKTGDSVSVGVDFGGNETVAAKTSTVDKLSTQPNIDLDWEVNGVDRKSLDLEALRYFFTDACLMTAAKRHLAAHGPRSLRGITYRRTASTKYRE